MKLKFNKTIYNKDAVKKGIKDFGEAADFDFGNEKDYYIVSISNIPSEVEDSIKDEFCNYVLYLNIGT